MSASSSARFYAIKNALTPAEKELIKYYDLQWMLRRHVPTTTEVWKFLQKKYPRIKQTSVNYYLQRQPVQKALTNRGIPWQQHSQADLTEMQIAAANVVMNFIDKRSVAEKLDSLGIQPTQYNAWLSDPQFKTLIDSLAEQNKINVRPTAITEFTKKINEGDWNAIKYWLETTGEMKQQDAPQTEQILMFMVEILQEEIKDPEILIRIASRMKQAMGGRALEAAVIPQQISNEPVEDDIDLADAKKKLGLA